VRSLPKVIFPLTPPRGGGTPSVGPSDIDRHGRFLFVARTDLGALEVVDLGGERPPILVEGMPGIVRAVYDGLREAVWVVEGRSGELLEVDAESFRLRTRYPVGTGAGPVIVDPITGWVAVGVELPPRLAIVDPYAGVLTHEVPLPGPLGPLLAQPSRGRLLQLLHEPSRLALVDPQLGAVVRTFDLPGRFPCAAALAPGADLLVVGSQEGTLRAVSVGDGHVEAEIPLGGIPRDLHLFADGATVLVTVEGSSEGRVLGLPGLHEEGRFPQEPGEEVLALHPHRPEAYVLLPSLGAVGLLRRTSSAGGSP
jgi:hypothetical protein